LKITFIAFLALMITITVWAKDDYPFNDLNKRQRFLELTHQFRCLVCQNEDLASSNAALAKDLRGQVFSMIQAGENDAAITRYMLNRYGEFVLFKPQVSKKTYFLWFGPLIFLLIAIGILWWRLSR
jgi:cytochrome c-type biogenesis protein CcmH